MCNIVLHMYTNVLHMCNESDTCVMRMVDQEQDQCQEQDTYTNVNVAR